MSKKIVFISTIGNTDPLRDSNDGPMIHIARKYFPDKIYLLLTSEMQRNHEKDNRYIECLEQLYEQKNSTNTDAEKKELDCEIVNLGVEDASDFEAFTSFTDILEKILKENEGAEFIANVTSGTPQMISSLALCIVINNLNIKTIQVKTHKNSSNKDVAHSDDSDINNSLDNDESFYHDRCVEVNLFNFRKSACYHQISAIIEEYDYFESLRNLKKEKFEIDSSLLELLQIGCDYMSFNTKNLRNLCSKYDIYFDNTNLEKMKILNSYNILLSKKKLKNYSDFCVRLTPLFFLVCVRVIKRVFDLDKITYFDRRKNSQKVSLESIQNYDLLNVDSINNLFNNKDIFLDSKFIIAIYSSISEIKKLSPNLCFGDSEENILNLLESVRKIEENIRNKVAHDTIHIIEQDFRNENTTPDDVLKMFRELITYAFDNKITKEDFVFFEELNKKIKEQLKNCL